jgi:uncharacterized protein (TIGR03086 family)
MLTNNGIRSFHRTAVLASVDIVDKVTPEDLKRATPCDGWDLAQLLAHMTVQHRGFAAAARGAGAGLTTWDPATVADVLDAFADDRALTTSFALPEFGPGAAVPGDQAIGFHFVDYVIHGWDVARAIDVPFTPADEVISAVLPLVFAVPDGDFRAAPESPFASALDETEAPTDLDRALLHLGRSPAWTAAR